MMYAMTSVAALEASLTDLARVVAILRHEDWDRPTPCPAWSVGDVLDHVLEITDKFTRFAAGLTDAPRGRAPHARDRRAALEAVITESRAAWSRVDSGRTCHLPFGDFSATAAAGINAADVLVHTWDIARGAGVDYSMPADLVPGALAVIERLAAGDRDHHHYARPPAMADGSGPDTLLIASGRSPNWPERAGE